MKTRELFLKYPLSWTLLNEGVSSNNSADLDTLRYELQTFVCQGEYYTGLVRMLQGYLDHLGKEQIAAWVSGFYGSGKSHLVKVLRYLWTDYEFPDGATARGLTVLPAEVSDLLKELSTRGRQGAGLHAAGGTLKAGVGDVRLRLLTIVLQSIGLPEKLAVARLLLDLRDEGRLEEIQAVIRAAGKEPALEFDRLYTSKALQEAYLASHPHLGDLRNVGEALRAQYPTKVEEISIDAMITLIRRALARNGQLPCTVIVLDEIQQFINNNADVALAVQEVAEACEKMLDGRVLLVGTGQSALTDTPALQRILGRFQVKVHLKDNDVERVVRTVVLQKREERKPDIDQLISRQSGEITRQLKTTRIATRADDHDAYIPDYPLLPVRRRFWEQVLHSIDPTGTSAEMRTQLRVTFEACRSVANQPLGAVIPADFLYDQLANNLVISGEMQKRFQEIIEEQKVQAEGSLRSRLCALVFLINKLLREGADSGVRANAEHLADLLTDDLGHSAVELRQKIPPLLAQLVGAGVLMDIEGEYRLQTTEGAAWESEFRRRLAAAKNNDAQIAAQRGQFLAKAIQEALAKVLILHGAARVQRKVFVHYGLDTPTAGDGLVVWVRDGFQESETAVLQDIQRRSVDDATLHVLIPKLLTDELKNALAAALAAEETLNFKGNPSSAEGREARAAMQTRASTEAQRVSDLIAAIVAGARVFLSGGQELAVITLREAVERASDQVLDRLFPQFHPADSANWPTVWKKAKEGSAAALGAVGHSGDPDKHPLAVELLRAVGAGKRGTELVARFTAPPYGWPKDAVDAALATLLVSGHLSARWQGQPLKLADLDQRRIGQVDFRIEQKPLTAVQKLRIRQLYQAVGQPFQPGSEEAAAAELVQRLKVLARSAGGEPPAPEPPHDPGLLELEGLSGNELLRALFGRADDLTARIAEWQALAGRIAARLPGYDRARQLVAQAIAAGLAGADQQAATLDAIQANRSLLHEPDPVTPVLQAVGGALRGALRQAHADYERILAAERARLDAHPAWAALVPEQQEALLSSVGIAARPVPVMGSDEELLAALHACDLATWRAHTDALPTRFAQALAAAIQEAEPKARPLDLPPATLRTVEEMESWLDTVRKRIEAALRDGPVIL